MTDTDAGEYFRLNLEAAEFLNGTGLPRALTLNDKGQVATDGATPATTIDLSDVIVFPGLVNSHEHLEFNLYPQLGTPPYEDVDEWGRDVQQRDASIVSRVQAIPLDVRRYWGLLRNLSWGVTTVMDHGEKTGAFDCELPVATVWPFRFEHRADTRWSWLRARFARGNGPLVFHVGEGTNETVARRSTRFLRSLRKHSPLIGVHGISLGVDEARCLDALVWCPVSNLFLFERTADVAQLKGETEILFGTDANISASGSIWDHLRTARSCGGLTDAELLNSLTATAMRVWGLGNTGDMVIARRLHADPWESFFRTTAADICAVISQKRLAILGETFYRDLTLDAWHDNYKVISIGNVTQRVYCPAPTLLSRLATIDDSPVAIQ